MERCFTIILTLLFAFAGFSPAAEDSTPAKEQCLACHGPFDKLATDTADFKAKSGETGTPHRYIAHDTKDIPECTECHKPHAIPLQDKTTVEKPAGVDWCYSGCHHTSTLEKCSTCH